jgi:cellulose synthase/poly-beta-1,6-N-acetylglucosamine synthase-like glycosyltransferase
MEHIINLLKYILLTLQLFFSLYLLLPFLFYIIFIVRKKLRCLDRINRMPILIKKDFKFNIIITAHQETDFIPPLLDSLQKQSYQNFQVYVVADDMPSAINFDSECVITLHPAEPLHSKISSIAYAMDKIADKRELVLILDADNLLHPDFLSVMNTYFQKGYQVVQADFKAKNSDTPIALMDSVGDMYNFFVDREMRMELGLSSAIWGAGIVFQRGLYDGIEYMDKLGGFDKKLQMHLASSVDRIAFAKEAILYDEKIVDAAALQRQRTRWISAQLKYTKQNLDFLFKAILRVDFNSIYFGFCNVRPPLFITLGMAIVLAVLNLWLMPWMSVFWMLALIVFAIGFILIVRLKTREDRYLKALKGLPHFLFAQVLASLQTGKAKQSFMKTTHHHVVYIDDILNKHGN